MKLGRLMFAIAALWATNLGHGASAQLVEEPRELPAPAGATTELPEDAEGARTSPVTEGADSKMPGKHQQTRGPIPRAEPLARVDTRIRSRIDSRLDTRIDETRTPLTGAAQKKRQADERATVQPH